THRIASATHEVAFKFALILVVQAIAGSIFWPPWHAVTVCNYFLTTAAPVFRAWVITYFAKRCIFPLSLCRQAVIRQEHTIRQFYFTAARSVRVKVSFRGHTLCTFILVCKISFCGKYVFVRLCGVWPQLPVLYQQVLVHTVCAPFAEVICLVPVYTYYRI